MKRFTSIQLGGSIYRCASTLILTLFLFNFHSNAQCSLACNDSVQISIEADCTAYVTPDSFIEGELPAGSYTIVFDNGEIGAATGSGTSFTGVDWSSLFGETGYTITANGCSNSCWGKAVIEQNIFPVIDADVECDFIPAVEGMKEVELTLADIVSGVEVSVTVPNCSSTLGITPTFEIEGEINFPCTSDPSGWCTLKCDYTIGGVGNFDGNLTYGIVVKPTNEAIAREYLRSNDKIVCKLSYSQPDCIPCQTWCGGNPPEFISIDSLRILFREVTGDCVNNITNLREVVTTEGEVCEGIITKVETYGDFGTHGLSDSRLLLSQAYIQLPIELIKRDGSVNDAIIFPDRITVDCGESTDPTAIPSVPVFHNLWREIITHPDTCRLVHFEVPVDTVREPVEIVPGVWSVQDVIKKELRDSMRCAPDSSQVIRTNPFEPLYPSKFCNLVSSFSDAETPICGNGKKIIRDWTIVDWCKAKIVTESQIIEEKDTTPPVGPDESVTHTLGTEPWTCVPNFDIDYPAFTDNCDDELDIRFDIINDAGVWVPVETLKPGTYFMDFTAKDDCNNTSKVHRDTLVVVDDVPPVSVCKDKLIVSITPDVGGGIAKILAPDFDKGSHDGGCSDISKMLIIRHEDFIENIDGLFGGMTFAGIPTTCDPEVGEISIVDKDKFGESLPPVTNELAKWHDSVKFCCEDIGPDNLVILRVWDSSNNYNDCVVNVEVQDKTLFSCPESVTIKCTEYSEDMLYGEATADLVCNNGNTSYEDEPKLDGCGAGQVLRIWSSTNGSGITNSCPQIINVESENVFDPLSIRWPVHYQGGEPGSGVRLEPRDGECVELPAAAIEFEPVISCMDDIPSCGPEYDEAESCGLVGTSVKSDTIYQNNNTCLKIIRRWTVIDWCTWSPNGDRNAEVGDDDNDTDADQFQLVEDWCLESGCIKDESGSKYYRFLPTEDGGVFDNDGYYTFDQVLLFNEDTKPVFMGMERDTIQPGTENSCLGNIALVNSAMDEGFCGRELLQWFVTLNDSTGTQVGNVQTGLGNAFGFTVSEIPLGKYTIVWNVKDGCGNEATQETDVTLEDTSKPTPICLTNISTAVMNTNGEVEIWAADFDPEGKSFDPCGDEVFYSFERDSLVPNLTITCADLIGASEEMFVYVQDETGNASACRVNLRVDHGGICDDFVCDAVGGMLLTDVTDLTETTVCTRGDNTGISVKVWENEGDVFGLVVTDEDGNILAIPTGPDIDFTGTSQGVCSVWHISSIGNIRGLEVGNNISDVIGCFDLSNPIIVNRVISGIECDGECVTDGGVFITDVTDLMEVTVCVSGENTGFSAKVWENIGDPSQLLTDGDGNILDIPVGPDFDFAGSDPGMCYLWHVSSDGPLTGVEIGLNANDIGGCFSLSNPIIVTKVDSGEPCEAEGSVAIIGGNVSTAFGESIGNARVKLNNPFIAEYPVSNMTSDLTGNYAFGSNPMYSDYDLSVEKNDDHMNGVSTLDLVYMQHHILGLRPLDSPYKVIAADINDDQRITASDLVVLRKLILGIIAELPDNSSWRFVDKNQTFGNIYQPWPFTENITIADLSNDMANQDFVGVKIGDVNSSAKPNSIQSTEVRSKATLELQIDDQAYAIGDLVEVKVNSEEFKHVIGFQMTIAHEGLELIGIDSDAIEISEDNLAKHGAMTTLSWNTESATSIEEEIMTLVFLATENLKLSDAITITDRVIPSEIYFGDNYQINGIGLTFTDNLDTEVSFSLLQNKPNPFSEVTEIGFQLPKSDMATLKLFDVSGRLLHKETGSFDKGLNTISISSDKIGSGGLIYYTLESGMYSATKKMIHLK